MASDVDLVNGLGDRGTKPYVTKSNIVFNSPGKESDSFIFPKVSNDLLGMGLGHVVAGVGDCPTMYSRVCNTKFLPYTEVVLACLKAAHHLDIIPAWKCATPQGDGNQLTEGWDLFDIVRVSMTNTVN